MKNINQVLRNKRVQLAELTLEISGLEAAATALRPVVHLLDEEDALQSAPATHISISTEATMPTAVDEARAVPPDRSRVRRWV